MQLQTREKNLLSVLLLTLVVVGAWHFALAALWERYIVATNAAQSLSGKLEQAKMSTVERHKMEREQSAMYAVLAQIAPLTEGDPGAEAVRRLTNIARSLDLRLLEVKPAVERKSGSFFSTSLSVRGDGDYAALMQFFTRLHTALPAFEITRVQISSSSQQSDRVEFSLSMVVRRYQAVEAKR